LPQRKKRKYNVGRAERRKRREAAARAETHQAKSLLTQLSEAHQAHTHAASLTATVSDQLTKIYTSSSPSLALTVSTEKIVTPPRTHPSRTETQGETNSFLEEQEQETFFRENTPSDVISIEYEEEEQARDTPYSPVQSTSPSPVLPPTFPSAQPDDYYFLGAGSLEQRISEQQSRSTPAISQSSSPPHTYIPQGPSRQYDSYRPQNRYRARGRIRRHQPRLYRRE
jgi:hypothetical protein